MKPTTTTSFTQLLLLLASLYSTQAFTPIKIITNNPVPNCHYPAAVLRGKPFFLSVSECVTDDDDDDNISRNEDDNSTQFNDLSLAKGSASMDVGATKENVNVPKIKKIWTRMFPRKKDSDGLTVGQKLRKMGMSVLLSYGFVSNMSYSVTVSLAWYIFSKRTALSPIAPGQWPKFLAVYAGFYVFNNIIRPLRITLSVYVSTFFDKMVMAAQERLKCSKGLAIGAIVFFFNIVGTLAAMSAGITLASIASGVPIWAK